MFSSVFFQLIIRHGLTAVSGILVARGLLPDGGSTEFITGILTFLAGGVLSAMQKDSMLGVFYGMVRHVLTFGSGFLVAQGWISPELSNQIVFGIMSLIAGGAWSWDEKTGTGRA